MDAPMRRQQWVSGAFAQGGDPVIEMDGDCNKFSAWVLENLTMKRLTSDGTHLPYTEVMIAADSVLAFDPLIGGRPASS